MNHPGTLILTRHDVAALLDLDACIAAVEQVLGASARNETLPSGILGVHVPGGGFHVKAAGLRGVHAYFAAKINANFPGNGERFGLPTIQGIVALFDAENGYPLAVLDSAEITALRTGAATAVAAKYLARPDSRVATIFGCGQQGRVQLRALARVLPIERAFACDGDPGRAKIFAEEMSAELRFVVEMAADGRSAARECDVCVTCTTAQKFFLKREHLRPGTFVAAVGADNPEKQELEPELVAEAKIVTDLTSQCAVIGELHHAIEAGLMREADVHAELVELVSGQKPGRTSVDEITIFDSTGIALEDVAAAAVVYEKATAEGRGQKVILGE